MTGATRAERRSGSLAEILVEAGVELAREGGPEAVVLREATRRVGVSATAAYRHFADHQALLLAVAAVAMSELARSMEAAQRQAPPAPSPSDAALLRLRGVGAGYLHYARSEPGLFRTAFAMSKHLTNDPRARGDSGLTPLQLLTAALDGLVDVGAMTIARRPGAEVMAWSAVHGLSMLLIDGPLSDVGPAEGDELVEAVLQHIEAGLLAARP